MQEGGRAEVPRPACGNPISYVLVVRARALYHCEALCKKEDVQRFSAGGNPITYVPVVSARALYHCEALCKKEDVQRFHRPAGGNPSTCVSVVSARALYHCEALCKKEDVQRFLAQLVNKRPEVGHLVKCFHTSKSADTKEGNSKATTIISIEKLSICIEKNPGFLHNSPPPDSSMSSDACIMP